MENSLPIVLLVLSALAQSLVSSSSVCGSTGRACVAGRSSCVGGLCRCNGPDYVWGDPHFMCYTPKQVAAEVKNDPILTNFNGESSQFPFPCRYLLAHVSQNLQDGNNTVIGRCEVQVFGFNRKSKGKMFVYGFDVALHLEYFTGRTEAFSLRQYGTEASGKGTRGRYLPNGPWAQEYTDFDDDVNGVYIRNYFHSQNKQTIFEANQCGILVTFVPFDEAKGRLTTRTPGLSVAVSSEHDPRWLSKDLTMGLSPVKQGGQTFADVQGFWLTVPQTVVARAFLAEIPQNQPGNATQCELSQHKMAACNDLTRAEAMTACFWVLREARFIRCIDQGHTANRLLFLFNKCVEAFCEGEPQDNFCQNVVNIVRHSGCADVPGIPVLASFVKGDFCPP